MAGKNRLQDGNCPSFGGEPLCLQIDAARIEPAQERE